MRLIPATLKCFLFGLLLATSISTAPTQTQQAPAQVVFVCEHGNVKCLIAAVLFNQAAQKRGLALRSISRGIKPDASVPAKIAAELEKDGADVTDFKPIALTQGDVSAAQRVIAIGVELTRFSAGPATMVESWTDVPPASVDYAAARGALLRHVTTLVAELQASGAEYHEH